VGIRYAHAQPLEGGLIYFHRFTINGPDSVAYQLIHHNQNSSNIKGLKVNKLDGRNHEKKYIIRICCDTKETEKQCQETILRPGVLTFKRT
jgi:hypothetical protein